MTIIVTVVSRIATISATERIVAGNTYPVTFTLDSEWTGSLYVRVRFGSQYYDIPMESSAGTADVQFPVGYPEVGIGVFSEALQICTNEVRVKLLRSILEQGVSVVDFDGDLYDQWAGEVTELLTDDAFDLESTRPVQNAVITAWKGTVPLDSAIVHKSGNETIAGVKTFEDAPVIADETVPQMDFSSEMTMYDVGARGRIRFADDSGVVAVIEADRNEAGAGCAKIKVGTDAFPVSIQAAPNYGYIETGTYYEAPSGQTIPDNVVIVSKNLATDPRLVHTSGNETIAGEKTLTAKLTQNLAQPIIDLISNRLPSVNYVRARIQIHDNGVDNPQPVVEHKYTVQTNYNGFETDMYAPDRQSSGSVLMRRYADHTEIRVNPYYPVDGDGNPVPLTEQMLVTSGNIAIDPRIVHATGNETIAGTKTFLNAYINSLKQKMSYAYINYGVWQKRYEYTPGNDNGAIIIEPFVRNNPFTIDPNGMIVIRTGTVNTMGSGRVYHMMGQSGTAIITGCLAKRASDGVIEVWIKNNTTSVGMNLELNVRNWHLAEPTVKVAGGDKPTDGETYTTVRNFEEIA